ncbi:MAG: phage tail protein [Sinimarinibacterium sp.]|jgi:hypothetical protein
MANLVLGFVGAGIGFMLGGPGLAVSIGFALGSTVGSMLFPQTVEGPQLTDTKIHTSSHGVTLPTLFGTIDVTGNCIWKTDLVKHKNESGGKGNRGVLRRGGKGGPSLVTYTYTASFALALGERADGASIRQLYEDGTLIFDADSGVGELPCTFYDGAADQLPDPTIEAALGAGNAPAYRQTMYAVFTDYGLARNSIPVFKFVIATMPETQNLRIVRSNYATGAWAVSPNNYPILIDWPASGRIVVSAPSLATEWLEELNGGITFDPATLAVNGTATSSDSGLYRFPIGEGAPSGGWYGIGMYQYTDHQQALWRSNGDIDIGAGSITDSTLQNFLQEAGVPDALFVSSCCMSQDGYTLWAFTNATSSFSANATHWYKVVEGLVVDDGTVSPALGIHAFGVQCAVSDSFGQMSAENNGEYFWYLSQDQHTVVIYRLDPDTGNFAATGMTLQIPWPSPAHDFLNRSTLKTLAAEGYAGAFFDDSMVLMSRRGAPPGMPLADIHSQISVACSYDPAEIDVTGLPDIVPGYKLAQQMSGRDALLQLQTAYIYDVVESSGVLKCVKRGTRTPIDIPDDDLCARPYGEARPVRLRAEYVDEGALPRLLNLSYVSAVGGYQTNTQIAQRQVVRSKLESSIQLAISLEDAYAARLVNALIIAAWVERIRFPSFTTSRKWAHLEPTDVITARSDDGIQYEIRITNKKDLANNVVEFEGVQSLSAIWSTQAAVGVPADGTTPNPPVVQQSATVEFYDVPLIGEAGETDTGFRIGMAGVTDDTWKGGALAKSIDGGATYADVAWVNAPTVMGRAMTLLGPWTGGNVVDEANRVILQVGAGGGELESVTDDALLAGDGLLLIGNELVQVRTKTLVAPGRYECSGLLRGRYGTEWAMATHTATDRFAVMATTVAVDAPVADLFKARLYKAVSVGENLTDVAAISFANMGAAARPLSPVHVGGGQDGSGNVTLVWTRRTRIDPDWSDFVDAPLGETSEAYVVQIWDATYTSCARIIPVTAPTATYSAADQVTDFGATQLEIYWTVGQVGRFQLGTQTRAASPGAGSTVDAVIAPIPPYNAPAIPPAGGGGAVNVTLSYPSDLYVTAGYKIGDTFVAKFTTGGSAPTAGYISCAEYGDPAYFRHMRLCTDAAGLSLVPGGEQYGSSHGGEVWFSSVTLAPATDYYFVVRTEFASGVPSGPLGSPAQMRIALLAT